MFQNRETFKFIVMDSDRLHQVRNINYGQQEFLRYVYECSDNYLVYVFETFIMMVDPESFHSVIKRKLEFRVTKVVPLSEEFLMAITVEGFLLLLNKQTLEPVYEKKVSNSYLYDIIKTSRRNEWMIFTHDDGLVFVSWVQKYCSEEHELVMATETVAAG